MEAGDRTPLVSAAEKTPLPAPLLDTLDRCGAGHIVHVGGGDGTLLAELLWYLPRSTGVLCDGEAAVGSAPAVLAAAGVEDRVDVAPIDPSDPVPPGGDVYLIDVSPMSDHDARRLLGRCRAAMAPSAHLVVLEPTSGRVPRRLAHARIDLLVGAGFDVLSCDTTDPVRVLLARPHARPTT
jgi:2,7-dihydroxy-5-methyl-1-naphthoate 7-O-methyltransferase